VNGWKRLREWLADAPDGKPWLMAHPDCTYLIRTLPSLVSDTNKPEDVIRTARITPPTRCGIS
jgi:hypothetical protein